MMELRIHPEKKKLRLRLSPARDFWLVPTIAILSLAYYMMMVAFGADVLNPDPVMLYKWGANQRNAVLNGDYWRLFSALFIHHGLFHLSVNLFGFWLAGRILEPLLGWKSLALLLVFSGVVANVCSFFWEPVMLTAGASGMVFGMSGAILIFIFTSPSYFRELVPHVFLLIVLFVLQMVYGVFNEYIDHVSHTGGGLAGLLSAILLTLGLKNIVRPFRMRAVLGLFAVAAVLLVFVQRNKVSNPVAIYRGGLAVFVEHEKLAESAWLSNRNPRAFKEGIDHWQAAADTLERLRLQGIPEVLQVRLQMMELYCSFKMRQYALVIDYLNNDPTFTFEMYRQNKEAVTAMERNIRELKRIP